jgi:hypothetical protein
VVIAAVVVLILYYVRRQRGRTAAMQQPPVASEYGQVDIQQCELLDCVVRLCFIVMQCRWRDFAWRVA